MCGEGNMNSLFVKALKNKFDMTPEDARALAQTVKEVFKGEKEIEDMTIDKYTRSLFYELHKEKLLKLRRDEFKEKGKFIRKYYWSFNNDAIRAEADRKQVEEPPFMIYQKIPRNAWLLHSRNT
jgi:hypothetical protein